LAKELNTAKELLLTDRSWDEKEAALEKIQNAGYAAKDTLLKLLDQPTVNKDIRLQSGIIQQLVELSKECFDEALYNRLANIAADKTRPADLRLRQ